MAVMGFEPKTFYIQTFALSLEPCWHGEIIWNVIFNPHFRGSTLCSPGSMFASLCSPPHSIGFSEVRVNESGNMGVLIRCF